MMKGYLMYKYLLTIAAFIFLFVTLVPSSFAYKKGDQSMSESDGCEACGNSEYCKYNELAPDSKYCDIFSRRSLNYGIGNSIGAGLLFGPFAFVLSDLNGGLFREDLRCFFNYMHTDEKGTLLYTMPSDRDLSGVYSEKGMESMKVEISRPPADGRAKKVFDLPLTESTRGIDYVLKAKGRAYRLFNVNNNSMIVLDDSERIRCAGHYTKRGKGKHTREADWINLYCDSEFGSELTSAVPLKGGPYVNVTYLPVATSN